MNWLYAMGASPARYAVERHRWAEAAALLIPPNTFPGGRAAWTEANLHFARALGASHTGQIDVVPGYFTEDVVATFEGTDQRAEGREAAGQLIRYVHENAFDARMELKNLLVDEGKAAIEADFVGTHTAEFGGIQPAGRAVRVPYSVVYDLRGDKISALRIYFPMSLLVEQLTN